MTKVHILIKISMYIPFLNYQLFINHMCQVFIILFQIKVLQENDESFTLKKFNTKFSRYAQHLKFENTNQVPTPNTFHLPGDFDFDGVFFADIMSRDSLDIFGLDEFAVDILFLDVLAELTRIDKNV